MNLDLKLRAQKLLDVLEDWFLTSENPIPHYVVRQIEALKEAIEKGE